MPQKIAIVGSGLLGMTLALRLAERGERVTVFESSNEIGGLASTWNIGGVTWDKHYHVTLASDGHTRKLAEDIGLGDQFRWVETKTGFYTDGKLYSMSDTMEFLKFPPLDIISKMRLGATIFYASRVKDWKALEKVSVEDWLTKLSGRRTFEKIWRPLLKAKLGESYRDTSAAFIWATIQRMYAARNSGLKKEMFGYVRGGYATLLDRLRDVLVEKGVEIRLNSPVARVESSVTGGVEIGLADARRRNDPKPKPVVEQIKYAVHNATAAVARGFSGGFISEPGPIDIKPNGNADTEHFDQVILTCPSGVAERVLRDISDEERDALRNIKYQGIICASVLLKCSLSRFYVTNVTDDVPFTGVIEMSAMVDKAELGRNALVYLPKYAAPDDPIFKMTDAEIRTLFLDGLKRVHPHFNEKDVVAFRVSRVKNVFPLPTLRYSEHLPDMKTSMDGVYVVNSSHIVNGTLNVNETVALAERFLAETRAVASVPYEKNYRDQRDISDI